MGSFDPENYLTGTVLNTLKYWISDSVVINNTDMELIQPCQAQTSTQPVHSRPPWPRL